MPCHMGHIGKGRKRTEQESSQATHVDAYVNATTRHPKHARCGVHAVKNVFLRHLLARSGVYTRPVSRTRGAHQHSSDADSRVQGTRNAFSVLRIYVINRSLPFHFHFPCRVMSVKRSLSWTGIILALGIRAQFMLEEAAKQAQPFPKRTRPTPPYQSR